MGSAAGAVSSAEVVSAASMTVDAGSEAADSTDTDATSATLASMVGGMDVGAE